MENIIGLLPCGGLGLRMLPLRYPKELLPISYCFLPKENSIRPKLSIEFSLENFKIAGITKCFVVVPDWKPEIMRYLGDGIDFGMTIAYLHNSRVQGLADAIFTMEPWSEDVITALALPDTQFYPSDAFSLLLAKMNKKNADVVLGIFPTEEPQHFGTVEINDEGMILGVEDKPLNPKSNNIWGIAVWNTIFWKFFKSYKKSVADGVSISEIFQGAVAEGLRVFGESFEQGVYYDIGRIDHLPFVLKGQGFAQHA